MCRSKNDGGQRCAAHTRGPYEAATIGTPEWDEAAAAHASTPTGAKEIQEAALRAVDERRPEHYSLLRRAEGRGAAMRGEVMRIVATSANNTGPAAPVVDGKGVMRWYRDGQMHREDGPALVKPNGTQVWYRDGLEHRADGPSTEHADGTKEWRIKGVLHREDGPAIETKYSRSWYRDGQMHREDGPAYMGSDSHIEYWQHGKKHRVGGPAVYRSDEMGGGEEYWEHGERIS